MGLFDFSSDMESSDIDIESTIRDRVEESFQELPIDGLVVEVNGSSVNIAGLAKNYETRDRALEIARSIDGVSEVDVEQLIVQEELNEDEEIDIPEEVFYTIEEGDTLWAIAEKFYGDGAMYRKIVEANRDIIENENLIYPGETIRIP